MKRLLSILLTLALCVGLMPAVAAPVYAAGISSSVTVFEGTATSEYVPNYTYYNYCKSQYIIPADDLTSLKDQEITGLKWYLTLTVSSLSRGVKIVLSETTLDALDTLNSQTDVSGEPIAFDGTWSVNEGNEVIVALSTPYEYKGGNLLVTVLDTTGSYSSKYYFYGIQTETGKGAYSVYSDSDVYDLSDTEGYSRSFLPKTTLYTGDVPAPAISYDLYIAGVQVTSANAADLSVINGVDVDAGGEASFDPDTNVLTLNNAKITCATGYSTIQSDNLSTLTIAFSGVNSITAPTVSNYNNYHVGINTVKSMLVLSGDSEATLTIRAHMDGGAPENGALRIGALNITGGTVNVECPLDQYGPDHNPYCISLNNSTGTRLTVSGGKLISKGWEPLFYGGGAFTSAMVDSSTLLCGTEKTDGSDVEQYDFTTNSDYSGGSYNSTYRYVEATPVPPAPVTVFFEADGGTVSPESIAVMPGETYGELPTPKKDGYIFDGWVLCVGGGARLISNDSNTHKPLFRLATDEGDQSWDGHTHSNFKVGSTIVFDVTFKDAVPNALDINDKSVYSSLYTIEGSRIYGRIEMTNAYVNSNHHFMDIGTSALSNDYTINKFYVIDPDSSTVITGNSTVAATEGLNGKEGHALLAKWSPAYTVTVTPGAHMTPFGAEEQTVVQGSAITSVTYTADEGYCFPNDYAVNAVNGITVTRDSESQITVSGTPTADTAITLAEASKIPKVLKVETPVFDPVATSFEDSIDVTISCVTTGAAIHFTLDGSIPTANSEVTTGAAITLNATTTIKAIAILDGYEDSDVAAATYSKSSPSTGGGGATTYPVKPSSTENGNITVSPRDAAEGMTVTVTVSPDEGFALDQLIVKDKDGNEIEVNEKDGKYTFTMPAAAVEISATFKPAEETPATDDFPFVDVPETLYCREAVEWALENGVTGGTSPTTFSPKAQATRGQTMTFLWAAAGAPEPKTTENPFKDISEDDYYYKAILWAYENGITAGISADEFGPEVTVTRAQVATFLYGIAGRPDAGSEPFADVNDGDYFEAPVAWAYKEGITTGTSETTFSPDADCLREQIITFMYLYFAE